MKPQPGDPNVEIIPFIGSPWSARVWPLGLPTFHCCIDFLQDGAPVNTPDEWTITNKATGGRVVSLERTVSLDRSFKQAQISPGEEKFIADQGAPYIVRFNDAEKRIVQFATPIFGIGPAVVTTESAHLSHTLAGPR